MDFPYKSDMIKVFIGIRWESNRIEVDGDACIHCGKCLEVCPHNARECIHDFRTSVNNVFPAVAGQNENGYVS